MTGKRRKKKKISSISPRKVKRRRRKIDMTRFWQNIRERHMKQLGWVAAVAAVLLLTVLVLHFFTVENVIVEGNVHYSVDEIKEMVMGDRMGNNSIYLFLKYRNRQIEDVPFIESMSVTIESPDTVRISVFEKSLAGFVEYMGQYFYFDQDGTVVESSDVKTAGIPQIIGLQFDHIVLYEPLPVEDQTIFIHILDISHLMKKYEIMVDQIYFDSDYHITLYFDDCRINLGSTDYIDEKIMKLKMILPEIRSERGVLRMENYTPNTSNITFEKEK